MDSLAALAGMSRASFSDHFSRAFDQAPINFVQKARLRVAARLLEVTDLPIKAIAMSVGYAGSRPFSRMFQATYGLPPTLYRERLTFAPAVADRRISLEGVRSSKPALRSSNPTSEQELL